jgi:hypothetical protein
LSSIEASTIALIGRTLNTGRPGPSDSTVFLIIGPITATGFGA